MIIERYGIALKSLDRTHLQDVRQWRNKPRTLSYMQFQNEISEKMQEDWFNQLDRQKHLLFTYHTQDEVHGLVQLKDIDQALQSAEAGIIHGNENSENTGIPIIAIIVLMEIAFDLLGMKCLRAKMRHDNDRVIALNAQLGYERMSESADQRFPYFEVTLDRFSDATKRFRNTLTKSHGSATRITLSNMNTWWANRFLSEDQFHFIAPASIVSNA